MKLPCVLLLIAVNSGPVAAQAPTVRTGIEVLRERGFSILEGKRVGLITNPTGVDSRLASTIDILNGAENVNLVALFGPEHGARGDHAAGDRVDTYTDPTTGLPVYSLYGRTRKPTAEMLKGIDVLVYDIQDNGCRSYTYISTMGLAMEAAAEEGIEFVVLDRPNPLGGIRVEGPVVEPGYFSFVSQFPIPYVYGLTCGELATLLNEEGMLSGGLRCKLTVIPMKGWRREMTFPDTGLLWVPTSPHLPEAHSALFYVATGILGELQIISEGVGYTIPFQTFAAEWIDPVEFSKRASAMQLSGVLFRPISFKPFYGPRQGETLHGVQIHFTDPTVVTLMSIQFLLLQVHNEIYPDHNPFTLATNGRLRMFDRVMGNDKVRKRFQERMSFEDIRDQLEKDVGPFREKSASYYIY